MRHRHTYKPRRSSRGYGASSLDRGARAFEEGADRSLPDQRDDFVPERASHKLALRLYAGKDGDEALSWRQLPRLHLHPDTPRDEEGRRPRRALPEKRQHVSERLRGRCGPPARGAPEEVKERETASVPGRRADGVQLAADAAVKE